MAAPRHDAGSNDCKNKAANAAAWERFREAAWDPVLQRAAALAPAGAYWKNKQQAAELSIREKILSHGHDGNELQTTPEFRAHVAKKLDVILDNTASKSLITTSEGPLSPVRNKKKVSTEEDDGFRLFSSSVPGDCGRLERVPCQRPAPQRSSSSDSESDVEWQRCQEAAVSAADVLKQSGLPSALQESGQGQSCQMAGASGKAVKKTKRKAKGEDDSQGEAAGNGQNNPRPEHPLASSRACKIIDTVSRTETVARKKKKKKRRKAGAE